MHMADALISAPVGGAMWAVSGAMIAYSSRKLRAELDERAAPLMGVLGAFVFSAQMINFTIPATGSSGHLGGALLLAILLGPHAAFLTVASILTIQALFFADGGLLALGCNIFNIGFLPCFVAYRFVYCPLCRLLYPPRSPRMRGEGSNHDQGRLLATTLAGVVALQLGAFGVVLQTVFSGISELPFGTFAMVMLPIHLAIGLVEGLVTFGVVTVVSKARPELLRSADDSHLIKQTIIGFAVVTVVTAGVLSAFASTHPDGLEWSVAKVTGQDELGINENSVAATLESVQNKSAVLPDYGFREPLTPEPAVDTSIAGLLGALATLIVVTVVAIALRKQAHRQSV